MMLGARTAAWAKSGGWKNPYITDGLVAMWDGEWNAGGGVHDPNTTVWKDISDNGYDMTLMVGYASFTDDAIKLDRVMQNYSYFMASGSKQIPFNDNRNYFEVVFYSPSTLRNTAYTLFHGGGVDGGGYSLNIIMAYYWAAYSRGGLCTGTPSTLFVSDQTYELSSGTYQYSIDSEFLSKNGTQASVTSFANTYITSLFTRTYPTLCPGDYGLGKLPVGFSVKSLRIYDKRLSQTDRAANYAIDKARFNLP